MTDRAVLAVLGLGIQYHLLVELGVLALLLVLVLRFVLGAVGRLKVGLLLHQVVPAPLRLRLRLQVRLHSNRLMLILLLWFFLLIVVQDLVRMVGALPVRAPVQPL